VVDSCFSREPHESDIFLSRLVWDGTNLVKVLEGGVGVPFWVEMVLGIFLVLSRVSGSSMARKMFLGFDLEFICVPLSFWIFGRGIGRFQ